MSHYQNRLAQLAKRFGISKLLLAHESEPETVCPESILEKRRAVEKAERAAGYHVCKGAAHLESKDKLYPMHLLVKI
jgi:hypothetical protein